MQIVIEIPKYIVDMCKASGCVIDADAEKVGKAIATGTPLPEHKGKWIYDGDQIICNKCRTAFNFPSLIVTSNFCPECGDDKREFKEGVLECR